MGKRITYDGFVKQSNAVHGDKYTYCESSFLGLNHPTDIICPVHGMFSQKADRHYRGSNCPLCIHDKYRKSFSDTIATFKEVHSDKYTYLPFEVSSNLLKIDIECPDHGTFSQTIGNHASGHGCKKCTYVQKRMSTSEILSKFFKAHGGKYTYPPFDVQAVKDKIEIICPDHGKFYQAVRSHFRGEGCKKCADRNAVKSHADILTTFKEVHGRTYTYPPFEVASTADKIEIICQNHGSFHQTVTSHSSGAGCMKCSLDKVRKSTEEILSTFKEVHGEKYTYPPFEILTIKDSIEIICPDHGSFSLRTELHLGGIKCPTCVLQKRSEDILSTFNEVHGDSYIYPPFHVHGVKEKIEIICPDHGSFSRTVSEHKSGRGCKKCRRIKMKKSTSEILAKFYKMHGEKYSYPPFEFSLVKSKIEITCPIHGGFFQTVDGHQRGHGCPKCAPSGPSKIEIVILEYVKSLTDEEVISGDRKILDGKELDIYIPSMNLAFEYCGIYWHSDKFKDNKYHYDKWKKCEEQGIHLVTIFEDEWLEKHEKVKAAIKSLMGYRSKGIHARQGTIRKVASSVAKEFFEQYHLQGSPRTNKVTYGLYDRDELLVAAMSFGSTTRQSSHEWELLRYVTDGDSHAGAASRLFKKFVKEYNPTSVVSMSDNRWFTGGMYSILGFVHDGDVRHDYSYVRHQYRYHKSGFRKDRIKIRLSEHYDPSKTEREMMVDAGYNRIYDCGKKRWVWRNKD